MTELATSNEPKILQKIKEAEYKKYVGDRYQNHSQNLILSTILQETKKQRQFQGAAAEKFAFA